MPRQFHQTNTNEHIFKAIERIIAMVQQRDKGQGKYVHLL